MSRPLASNRHTFKIFTVPTGQTHRDGMAICTFGFDWIIPYAALSLSTKRFLLIVRRLTCFWLSFCSCSSFRALFPPQQAAPPEAACPWATPARRLPSQLQPGMPPGTSSANCPAFLSFPRTLRILPVCKLRSLAVQTTAPTARRPSRMYQCSMGPSKWSFHTEQPVSVSKASQVVITIFALQTKTADLYLRGRVGLCA